MRGLRSSLCRLTVIWALALLPALATAAEEQAPVTRWLLPQENEEYPFLGKNQGLRATLETFGRNIRVAVSIDEEITNEASVSIDQRMSRRAYLDRLSNEFGLLWFYDGVMLHVSSVRSVETEIIPLQDNDGGTVLDVLSQLGIYQEKFVHASDPKRRVFLVSGPASYVTLVKKAVEAIEEADRNDLAVVRGTEISGPDLTSLDSPEIDTPGQ
ncbi:hypothetical protein N6L27_16155 [Leisingera sp. SS27]|uniref:hypothetical protein n=1 Tax=Leisingera sp. SS27 TaxID=2979462 RepID=UPI00232E8366|nr:hypothetical protein [Leisingera sp. SS27]MDC0659536.1 hypothetical protein [Leisingera sp. SS27]